MSFKHWKIRHKLLAGFGAVILLMVLMGSIALLELKEVNAKLHLASADYQKTVQTHLIKDALNATARNMRNLLIFDDPAARALEIAHMEEATRTINGALQRLDTTVQLEQGRALLREVATARAEFLPARERLVDAVKAQRMDEAKALLINDVRPVQRRYMDALERFVAFQGELMAHDTESAEHEAQFALTVIVGLLALAIVSSTVIVITIISGVVAPLSTAVAVAKQVAAGDLTAQIAVDRQDETGEMLAALQLMNTSLLKIVREVRAGTESVATASEQISSSNRDLSSRTEQQAGTLEETASSME
ncbi:MAG: MCP four helix bundle domain-containing protein, partial [Burkholderiaceae bacterium]|nr:MCP four helix bundle domain-containing protein [Burkholderiaceae bacterium]